MASFLRLGTRTINTRHIRMFEKKENCYEVVMTSRAIPESHTWVNHCFYTPIYKYEEGTTEYKNIDLFVKKLDKMQN